MQVGKADQWLLVPSFLLDPEYTWLCEPKDERSASQDEPKVASALHVASGAGRERDVNYELKDGVLGRLLKRFSGFTTCCASHRSVAKAKKRLYNELL